jgi:hypothetical protein
VALALAECSGTSVMEVGANRYRITEESNHAVGEGEGCVIQHASPASVDSEYGQGLGPPTTKMDLQSYRYFPKSSHA